VHLSSAAFVDLLDGTTAESAVPHLKSCAACREQLAELRLAKAQVYEVDVPEPSSEFWEHLSARVRAAVAEETISMPWWGGGWWRLVAITATGVVVVALVIAPRMMQPHPDKQIDGQDHRPTATSQAGEPADDDPLQFVADLAADVDWDTATDAGLVGPGSADRVLAQMNSTERVELQRLLNEALARGGA
jgi:hypothetical protein